MSASVGLSVAEDLTLALLSGKVALCSYPISGSFTDITYRATSHEIFALSMLGRKCKMY